MRLRLTFGRVVWVDLTLFEVEVEDEQDDEVEEPGAVHDLSQHHEIGFSAAPGWRDPVVD